MSSLFLVSTEITGWRWNFVTIVPMSRKCASRLTKSS